MRVLGLDPGIDASRADFRRIIIGGAAWMRMRIQRVKVSP
jgi:hypothetical protein